MVATDERFWSKVNKTAECWLWLGAKDAEGYGAFRGRKDGSRGNVRAHRYAYEAVVGPIPVGLVIDHLCRNTSCVQPTHLEPVTTQVNLLRGDGLAARNAQATVCPEGHPYNEANTYRHGGKRYCRQCHRNQVRQTYAMKQEAQDGTDRT
jgi:hypothetical protein